MLLYAGHAGISTDMGSTINGFNPNQGGLTSRQLLNRLKTGEAFPGLVQDDQAVFQKADLHVLTILEIDLYVPPAEHQRIENSIAKALAASKYRYTYGFPNGDGDCNCVTRIERLGVPLLIGRMQEMTHTMTDGIHTGWQRRRFGKCK